MKKILSAILVLLFIAACFVSCAEKEPVHNGSGTKKAELTTVEIANETEPEETKEPTKAEIAQTFLDKIPNVKYNREFNVLCMQGVGNSEKEIFVEKTAAHFQAVGRIVFNVGNGGGNGFLSIKSGSGKHQCKKSQAKKHPNKNKNYLFAQNKQP